MVKPLAVISFSGGLDSTALLLHLLARGYSVQAFSFDYQQRHQHELTCSKRIVNYCQARQLNVAHALIDLSSAMANFHSALTDKTVEVPLGDYQEASMKDTVVPNRNAIFASIIYGHALSLAERHQCDVNIGLGVHSGDHAIYPDCRPAFYQALAQAFTIGNWQAERVQFYLPYLNSDKAAILTDAMHSCHELSLEFNQLFANTHTCYQPNQQGQSCGHCGSCTERLQAFSALNLIDPVAYIEMS